jgi:cytochrome c-type biogenesis protein CcmE
MTSLTHRAATLLVVVALAACHRRASVTVRTCKLADDVAAHRADLVGRPLLVIGRALPGSLLRRADCEYRFTLQRGAAQLPVHYAGCSFPEGLRDNAEVMVDGTLGDAGSDLEATQLRVRIPPLPYRELPDLTCADLSDPSLR